jgi:Toprim domain
MSSPAAELARRLAQEAEAVCRHYLSNGHRTGRYWCVGDVANTAGRSLYVRLSGPTAGSGAAGKWTDAATCEHGDLLDLIALNQNLPTLKHALDEARRFLAIPYARSDSRPWPRVGGPLEAAQRLFARGRSIAGTIAEVYLRHRGITAVRDLSALRFHPNCFYRAHDAASREARPALIAAVTDLNGRITGVQRTWLDPSGCGKAPIATPRRALGRVLGNGVRFGTVADVLVAGEGIETILSLKSVMPAIPMIAALSASHLAALLLPATLKRLYIACDADAAGWRACERLGQRAQAAGIKVLRLRPSGGDFNDDLSAQGTSMLWAALRVQIAQEDLAQMAPHWSR